MSELEDLEAKIDRLYEAVKVHNEWMEWGKTELEKAFKALGPVLSMAAPLVAQMTGGAVPPVDAPAPEQPVPAGSGPVVVIPTSTADGGATNG